MEKKLLERFHTEKIQIKLNLKNGRFFSGTIIELYDTAFIFKDKLGNELPFDIDSVAYIDIDRGDKRWLKLLNNYKIQNLDLLE